jgi:hypothetical protein
MVIWWFVKLNMMIFFVHRLVEGMISRNVVTCCVGARGLSPLRELNNDVVLDLFEPVGLQPCR